MPKNSWKSWETEVKVLFEILAHQQVHSMTHGSRSGGVGATASAHIGREDGAVSGGLNEEEVVDEEEEEEEQQHKERCEGKEEGDGEEEVEEDWGLGVMDKSAILS